MSELSKRVLSVMMVIGAQSEDRAVTLGELAAKAGRPGPELSAVVEELVSDGNAVETAGRGERKVYLTGTGIITASSAYS